MLALEKELDELMKLADKYKLPNNQPEDDDTDIDTDISDEDITDDDISNIPDEDEEISSDTLPDDSEEPTI